MGPRQAVHLQQALDDGHAAIRLLAELACALPLPIGSEQPCFLLGQQQQLAVRPARVPAPQAAHGGGVPGRERVVAGR